MTGILNKLALQSYYVAVILSSLLLTPFFLAHPRGRRRYWERFGAWRLPEDSVFWLHGASVGEMNGLVPLIAQLRERLPAVKILVTAVSPTGLAALSRQADYLRLLPFDHPIYLRQALRGLTICAYISTETELWPGLLHELRRRRVAVFLANARISDFSIKWYRRLRPIFYELLQNAAAIWACDQKSLERLLLLGADPAKTFLNGHSKYDRPPSVSTPAEAALMKQHCFQSTAPVLVLGSLRPGEDQIWLPALAAFAGQTATLNVILAPRHQEKLDFFIRGLTQSGLAFRRWSLVKSDPTQDFAPDQKFRLLLLDTLGELEKSYSFAEAAFIGGSLQPQYGGHNPLEAAAYGAALYMGPYCANVSEICDDLKAAGALTTISTTAGAAALLAAVANQDPALLQNGAKGRQVWERHCGASARIVDKILNSIGKDLGS